MIKTYIKKPLAVQAVQWTGDNTDEVVDFGGTVDGCNIISDIGKSYLVVRTLEGNMAISIGDYVIRGTSGEYYPCKPNIFEKIYEEQDDMTYKETITWHEVKTRPLTDEEKEAYAEFNLAYMLDCPLPDDGQEILVATKYGVDVDVCGIDEGYYLEKQGDWDDVLAWASMPRYKKNV